MSNEKNGWREDQNEATMAPGNFQTRYLQNVRNPRKSWGPVEWTFEDFGDFGDFQLLKQVKT